MSRLEINEILIIVRTIIIGKLQSGTMQRDIAIQPSITQSTLSKLKSKFMRTGDVKTLHRSERPKITTPRGHRFIENQI